ncbi:MAG: hypothetical protein ABI647_09880 [Gemmatimonadota bacterium]
MRLHLETCDQCRQLVTADAIVIEALSALPLLTVPRDLTDRVMARVTIARPSRVPVLSFPRLRRPQFAWAAAVAFLAIGTAAWSAFNRPVLDAWIQSAGSEAGRMGWLGIKTLAANLSEQPWFTSLRDWFAAPVRTIGVVGGGLALYLTALVAFKKLITPRNPVVSDANA